MIETHRNSRHPFEVLVVGFCVYSGTAQLISRSVPSTIGQTMSPTYQQAWSWTVLLAGLLAAAGIMLRDPENGLHLEAAGMIGLGASNFVYSGAILAVADSPVESYAAPITAGIGLACFARGFQILRRLWQLRQDPEGVRLHDAVTIQLGDEVRKIINADRPLRDDIEAARKLGKDADEGPSDE